MIYTDPREAAAPFAAQIAGARRILLLTHINPDGDAIGALLGVYHTLRAIGKQAVPLAMPPLPSYTLWLPGIAETLQYHRNTALPAVDLVMMVDTATLERVGPVYADHPALAAVPLVIVDHHVTNVGGGALNLIQPAAASTCELLYALFHAMQAPITSDAATCLLLGHTTDTQSYQTSATSPAAMRTAADLLGLGADHTGVVREVYYALPAASAQLVGMALMTLRTEDRVAWSTVTQAMMRESGAEDEAADEVVRVMQRIGAARALAIFKERADGTTKLSFRSRAPINVAALAQRWGGGGHAQAAGATLAATPIQAEAEVIPLLKALVATQERP
jgi:phosphoesterase RecJ-like protein